MTITTSYKAQIQAFVIVDKDGTQKPVSSKQQKKIIKDTTNLCTEAMKDCVEAFLESWDFLLSVSGKERKGKADQLIHGTSKRKAAYPAFDEKYKKMPAYTRRAIVAKALGIISSWKSNHKNWEEKGRQGKEPKLGTNIVYEPTFYKEDRDLETGADDLVRLRFFANGDWKFITVKLKSSDIRYIRGVMARKGVKTLSPVIEKQHGRYYVRFSFEEERGLVEKEQLDQLILAVDLGVNNATTMCVMDADGTIYGRKVFSLPYENDHLMHTLNATKKPQQKGYTDRFLWRKVKNINLDISRKTAKAILDMAVLYNIDSIVFEHLDTSGKKKGSKKQRVHHWKCREVQKIAERKAHQNGMRISRICAWNTSRLAFDGSGKVERGRYVVNGEEKYNYSICVFPTGKQYNCDLNASYNIGARFFLRAYQNKYGDVEVPAPQRTLSTLKEYTKTLYADSQVA